MNDETPTPSNGLSAEPTFRPSLRALEVERDIAATNETFAKVIESKESALAFLVRAGILDEKGELTRGYRD